jgi:hypothetical protein
MAPNPKDLSNKKGEAPQDIRLALSIGDVIFDSGTRTTREKLVRPRIGQRSIMISTAAAEAARADDRSAGPR